MRRLIYISSPLVGLNADDLEAIVSRSVIRNRIVGVTRMLWSTGTHFAQVLEGEHHAVGQTMELIEADPRHRDITVVADREVSRRLFGDWAMVRASDTPESADGTAFLIGFTLGQHSASARQLYDIMVESQD